MQMISSVFTFRIWLSLWTINKTLGFMAWGFRLHWLIESSPVSVIRGWFVQRFVSYSCSLLLCAPPSYFWLSFLSGRGRWGPLESSRMSTSTHGWVCLGWEFVREWDWLRREVSTHPQTPPMASTKTMFGEKLIHSTHTMSAHSLIGRGDIWLYFYSRHKQFPVC